MGVDTGQTYLAAVKKQTGAWGTAPIVLGAGDGVEFNSDNIKSNRKRIINEGITGTGYRRAGSAGNKLPGGAFNFDFYYNCAGLRYVAAGIGSGAAPTSLGDSAYRHDLALASTHSGLSLCTALLGLEDVRELPHVKVNSLKMSFSESEQRAKIDADLIAFDLNENVGASDPDLIVATAAAANGTKTIAAQPTFPSQITFVMTGVTELVTTLVGIDIDGVPRTEVHTRSTGTLDFTSTYHYKSVTSITCASIAGSGNFSAGVLNGVNNITTAAAVTTVATRDPILFSQARFYINDQSGADFAAGDEQFISKLEIGIMNQFEQRVTTKYGYRIDEPTKGGGGRPTVSIGLNFSAHTDRNRRLLTDQIGKNQLKAKLVCTGPPIGAGSTPHSLTIWLNSIQFDDGDKSASTPGVLPFDLSGEAQLAVVAPTGFPATIVAPVYIQLVNGLSTGILA
jgi:hypothetical protein